MKWCVKRDIYDWANLANNEIRFLTYLAKQPYYATVSEISMALFDTPEEAADALYNSLFGDYRYVTGTKYEMVYYGDMVYYEVVPAPL